MKKYNYLQVIQGNYGQGWEDLSEYDANDRQIRADLKEYRISDNYPKRIISRRELSKDWINANLKEAIKIALNVPESDFSNYCSDLYLLHTPEREKWLKENYQFWCNVRIERSNVDGQEWHGKRFFNIPFAYTEYHTKSIVY